MRHVRAHVTDRDTTGQTPDRQSVSQSFCEFWLGVTRLVPNNKQKTIYQKNNQFSTADCIEEMNKNQQQQQQQTPLL